MADNKIVIETEVKTGESVNSLKQLKQELKEAQSAALNGDGKAAKRVAELKDRMDDLKDATKSLQGSGIERAESSFRLLGEGFKNLDFEKVKIGLGGLKTALAATGVMLIVQAVSYLISNFDELSKGSGLLAKSLQAVGNVLTWIKDAVYSVTDAIGLTNSELDKQGEAIKENSDKVKEALSQQTAAFDRQIKVAQAAGKSTVELEKAKQQAIIDTNLQIIKQIENFVRAGGELDDEKRRILTASIENIKNAKAEQTVVDIKDKKDQKDRDEKAYQDWKALQDKKAKDELDAYLLRRKLAEEEAKWQGDSEKYLADQADLYSKEKIALAEAELNAKGDFLVQSALAADKAYKEDLEKAKQLEEQKAKDRQSISQASLAATAALSDLFFTLQLNQAKGNSAKELEIKKKQFQVDKALKVAQAVQDGILGVQSQLKAGPIVGPILAALVGVTAAANVAKILATKFDGGTATGDTSVGGGGTALPSLPQPSTTTAPNIQPTTQLDNQGNVVKEPKIWVSVSEINETQGRVSKLSEQAKF